MSPFHIFLAVLVMAAWGVNFVVIKVGLDHFPPILLSTLRFALAGLPIVLIWKTPPAPMRYIVAIAIKLAVLKFSLLFIGMHLGAGAGVSSLVLQVQAFFTVILAFLFLQERPNIRQMGGMALAFGGLGLILMERFDERGALVGLLFVIAAAMCWALSNIAMKKANSQNPLHLMIWVSAVSSPLLFAISWIFEGPDLIIGSLANVSLEGSFSVFYLAFVATLAGFGIWAYLLKTYQAAYVAPFSLLVPVFGMSSAAILLGETISAQSIFAAALIMAGLALNTLKFTFLKKSTTPSC